MKTQHTQNLLAAALAGALGAKSAFAQKMKTDIPAAITTPDRRFEF